MHKVYKLVELLDQAVRVGEPLFDDQPELDENHPIDQSSVPLPDEAWRLELQAQRDQIVQEAHQEKDQLLAQARKEAEALIKKAQGDCQALQEKARQAGLKQGVEEGQNQVEAVWNQQIAVIEQWFRQIQESRAEVLEKLKAPLMDLSVFIAEKIIQREAERSPFVLEMIERALEKLSHRERVVVRVSPREFSLVRERKDDLLARVDGIELLEFREDTRIEAGGCLVETVYGSVDARIKDQLEIIRETLLSVVAES